MKKLSFLLFCTICGLLASIYGQPYIGDNSDATLIIVTVFSVFAGFLVAIITILGDPSLIPAGSWRAVETRRDDIEHRIILHSALFIGYLLTIGGLFISVVLKKVPSLAGDAAIRVWSDRFYVFIAVTSFFLTFGLPFSLHKLQMSRLGQESARRRDESVSMRKKADNLD